MVKTKTFLLLLLVVLVVGVSGLIFFVKNTTQTPNNSTTAVTSSSKYDPNDCIPVKFGTEAEYQQNDTYSCIYNSLLASLDAGTSEFSNVSEFFESYGKKDGVFANICHLASHDAGSAYTGKTTPIVALQISTDFCFSGFVHGVFDFLGAADLDRSEWEAIARECEEISSVRPMACADGLGHASWDFYQDPGKAFDSCEIFTKPEKIAECSEGVVMQTYAPAVVKPASKILEIPSDFSNVCALVSNIDVKKGCFLGVGWLLGNNLASIAAPHLSGNTYPVTEYEPLLNAFNESTTTCLTLNEGSQDCLARFFTSIPYPVWKDTELREVLCESNPLVTDSCRAAALSMAG